MSTIDYSDPCAVANAYEEALFKLRTGAMVVKLEVQTGAGSTRIVEYAKANLADLEKALAQKRIECDAAQGKTPRRFAILGGTHRWPR